MLKYLNHIELFMQKQFWGYKNMIKPTFYNLSDDKRKRVLQAILEEFADTDSEKISINRIIKRANISRGSFYQYFDDKVDLVEVLFLTLVDMNIKDAYRALSESGGDIFALYNSFLEILFRLSKDEFYNNIMRNLCRSMYSTDSLIAEYVQTRCRGFDELNQLAQCVNRSKLRFSTDEEMVALHQIFVAILRDCANRLYVLDVSAAVLKSDFDRKIEIIKYGALL